MLTPDMLFPSANKNTEVTVYKKQQQNNNNINSPTAMLKSTITAKENSGIKICVKFVMPAGLQNMHEACDS